jgi:membrane associated rhomboid family serine protease
VSQLSLMSRQNRSFTNFLLKTWSGRILFINTLIFLWASYLSQSLMVTSSLVLWDLGAQDPIGILQGDYYRFFTPIFLHGGLIHFLFNSFAIYVVGKDLEPVFGSGRFLLIFLASGVFGSIASAALGVNQSVGASGAIFGLLGAGLFLEKSIARFVEEMQGRKLSRGPYMGMLLINVPLSFLPMIDAYAHFGGLLAGMVMAYALFKWYPNRLLSKNRWVSLSMFAVYFMTVALGVGLATNEKYITSRYEDKIGQAKEPQQKVYFLTSLIELQSRPELHRQRGLLLLEMSEKNFALADFRRATELDPAMKAEIEAELLANSRGLTEGELTDFLSQL